MQKRDVKSEEYDSYYKIYLDLLKDDLKQIDGYKIGKKSVIDFINSISNEKMSYKYAPKKWSINEVIPHSTDPAPIFTHRCFSIARNDTTALSGFDQDGYIAPSNANLKSKSELIEEFSINRDNSISLLKSLSDKNLCFLGNANGNYTSARACAFIVLGHDMWHTKIIKERYL